MDPNRVMEVYRELKKEAADLGYSITATSARAPAVNVGLKQIFIPQRIEEQTLFTLSHEIGHVLYRTKLRQDPDRQSVFERLLDEAYAWIEAHRLCVKYGMDLDRFTTHAARCLKTYVDQVQETGKQE